VRQVPHPQRVKLMEPKMSELDWKRIDKAIAASPVILDAIKRQPEGHYTKRQLVAELAEQLGGRVIAQDAIDRLEKSTHQIRYERHELQQGKGEYHIYLVTAREAAA
jgi:hypothetical protein